MLNKTSQKFFVSLRGVTKRFPGVVANRDVDLDLYAGQVHALLGENGAGKSTLMNIVAGLYQPDEGQIRVHGREVHMRSPRDAFALGIGMVHQHFMLVDSLTVIENILLGLEGSPLSLHLDSAIETVNRIAADYGLEVPLGAQLGQLSVEQRQRVEIIRLLYRQTEVLIFDEPTAVLTPQEAERLGDMMRQLALEGRVIVYITHKLKEALNVSDVITVMRAGQIVGTMPANQASQDQLVEMMIGERIPRLEPLEEPTLEKTVLSIKDLKAKGNLGNVALAGVDLEISAGEILGIAGVTGNGQRELAEVIAGLREATHGELWVNEQNLSRATPRIAIATGVSYIPGERIRMGLVSDLPVPDNLIMKRYRHPELHWGLFMDRAKILTFARALIEAFDIRVPEINMPVHLLSGGNQQKVILARELSAPHHLLVVEHPTRGLDVGASAAVHRMLREQRAKGVAILLISSDLDELLALCDRIAVIYEGHIVGQVAGDKANSRDLGFMMAGRPVHREEAAS